MTPLKGLLLHSQSGTGDRDLAEGEEGRQRALQSGILGVRVSCAGEGAG